MIHRRLYKGIIFAALAALLLSFSCLRRDSHDTNGVTSISVWHVWGGAMAEGFQNIKTAFERSHRNIKLRLVYASNDLATNQKFFTAVAASAPPDVIFVDGPQVAPWAEWGALTPLTNRLRAAGIKESDYFPPCWRQNHYNGDVWALTFCADPNFGFVWNKGAFREAGLNPEKPPRTMEELDEYAEKLTKLQSGELTSIGLVPWAQYGAANSMFTWGWAFRGRFYDYASRKITADDPNVVRSLQWIRSYAEKYDVTKIASLQAGFGAAEQNPFYTGKVAMMCLHIGGIAEIERYAPDLDYGVSFLPCPENGEEKSSWVGGWCISIPKGASHPDEAWELIRWLCYDDEGTTLVGRETGLFPGRRDSPYFDEVRGKPYYGEFLEILKACKHQRPVMPVQAYYMRQLRRAVDAAIYGKKTPERALRDAAKITQRELDLVLSGS